MRIEVLADIVPSPTWIRQTNEAKYFAIVLLKTSAWALHWGCAGVV
jgi:hypothetical protein